MPLDNPFGSPLEALLRRETQGEVPFDAFSRVRYVTDASSYQIEPLGVVVPRMPRRRSRSTPRGNGCRRRRLLKP
jgi:hypothetical protein